MKCYYCDKKKDRLFKHWLLDYDDSDLVFAWLCINCYFDKNIDDKLENKYYFD